MNLVARILVFLCLARAEPPAPAIGRAGPDLSAGFRALLSSRERADPGWLRGFVILFIPGFNADFLDDSVGYFRRARAELSALGLVEGSDFLLLRRQAGFSGERTMEENARAIAGLLRASGRPVLAIAHSKGSVDLLHALLGNPGLRERVRGFFSVQGAIGGSILADVLSRGWTRPLIEGFLLSYGGSIAALEDLRRPVRSGYLLRNLPALEEALRGIPSVSLVTQQDHTRMQSGLRTLVELFDPDYLLDRSDGMIEIRNAFLPGAPFVFLSGVDHNDTVQTGSFDQVRLLHAALLQLRSLQEGGR